MGTTDSQGRFQVSATTRILRAGEVIEFTIHDDDDFSHFDRYVSKVEGWSRASEYAVQMSKSRKPHAVIYEQTFVPNR